VTAQVTAQWESDVDMGRLPVRQQPIRCPDREPRCAVLRCHDSVVQPHPETRHVLLNVYAKCIDGQDELTRQRIELALALSEPES
jgi:hypothetical protein